MTLRSALLYSLAALIGYAAYAFNALVRHRNRVAAAWSDVDVQLRLRADLIPNLVEVVKGYAAHERGLFQHVTELRSQSLSGGSVKDQSATGQAMAAALGRLFAVAEAYPELKADANFRDLQGKLSQIEDQIQLSRRYYNGTVRDFNTMIESFPSNVIAGVFRFRDADFFLIGDEAARAVPQIEMNKR